MARINAEVGFATSRSFQQFLIFWKQSTAAKESADRLDRESYLIHVIAQQMKWFVPLYWKFRRTSTKAVSSSIIAPSTSYICLRFLLPDGAESARGRPNLFWQSPWLPWIAADANLFDFCVVTSRRTLKEFFVFRLLALLLIPFLWEMSSIGTGVSMAYIVQCAIAKCAVNTVDTRDSNLTFVPVWPVRLAILAGRACISSGIRAESRGKWRVSFARLVPCEFSQ